MICPRCEKANQEDASYCPYCGLNFTNWEMKLAKYGSELKTNGDERIYILANPDVPLQAQDKHKRNKGSGPLNFVWKHLSAGFVLALGIEKKNESFSTFSSLIILSSFCFLFGLSGGIYLIKNPGEIIEGSSLFLFGRGFLQSILAILFLLLVSGGILYWIIKKGMLVRVNRKDFFIQFATFHTLSLLASLCLFLLVLIGVTSLSFVLAVFQTVEIAIIIGILSYYLHKSKRSIGAMYPGIFIWVVLLLLFKFLFGNQLPLPFLPI